MRADYDAAGIRVIGVSPDPVTSHVRFRDKYDLPFTLLADEDRAVMEKYGAWGEKNMYGKKTMGTVRTTVLVGADGKVEKVFPKVKVDGHVSAVLEAL
jgi:peroxiredoxin Q/BCP